MAYHLDLFEHAVFLSDLNPDDEPKQADLRRAVSAAYYALFHLLTTEAAENWGRQSQRSRFARMFDHGRMKACCSEVRSRALPSDPAERAVAEDLKVIAETFIKLQQERNVADYDNARLWSRTQVWELISEAVEAIIAWTTIRETDRAQEFLLDLLRGPR